MKTTRRSRRAARRLFRMCTAGGALDEERARSVAQRLGAARHQEALAILTGFRRLVRLDRDRHMARVESAVPLPADVRDDVEARLARRYGGRLRFVFAENPGLIAGLLIRVGSDVYDGSLRARLQALASRF